MCASASDEKFASGEESSSSCGALENEIELSPPPKSPDDGAVRMAPTQGSFTMIPMMLVGSRAPPALREPPRERHGVSMTPQTSFSDVLVSRHRRACYTTLYVRQI